MAGCFLANYFDISLKQLKYFISTGTDKVKTINNLLYL